MKKIEDYSSGRDNNYNLLRFIAATMVIYSHCYPLALRQQDPLMRLIPHTFGGVAVNIFFVTSGFLVIKSLLARNGIVSFFWARILRIYPGLIVALLFTIVVVGGFFTEWSLREYFSNHKTYTYFVRNINLVNQYIQLSIPSVFAHLPRANSINGSLWTLPWEIWMYISLGCLGYLGIVRNPAIIGCLTVIVALVYFINPTHELVHNSTAIFALRFITYFYMGSCCYLFRKNIPLGWVPLLACVILLVLSFHTPFFTGCFAIFQVYAVFCLAYLPGGFIRTFNNLGDYSYGIYIYAFPIQQSLIALNGSMKVMSLFCSAFIVTLALAALSWHFIEKPFLQFKGKADYLDVLLIRSKTHLLTFVTKASVNRRSNELPQPEIVHDALLENQNVE